MAPEGSLPSDRPGHERTIYLGPQARAIVSRWLQPGSQKSFLLSPREGEKQRRSTRRSIANVRWNHWRGLGENSPYS